jgi:3-hydroxymyristoyl/3-hydroxydecanoyl-(acyl carrier protein) dehydratases
MNREELKSILPHREPMLLLDEAVRNDDGSATGYYTVRGDEFFLQGHFPDNPIVPGVIQLEMMAQTCGVLMSAETATQTLFTGIDKVRFRQKVSPGDTLRFDCRITKSKAPFHFAEGKGYVDGKLCVQAEFSIAILP